MSGLVDRLRVLAHLYERSDGAYAPAAMRIAADELEKLEAERDQLRAERDAAQLAYEGALAKLNAPELRDFAQAVVLEAAHQRERWGVDHDAGKAPADWYWLLGWLAGKAVHALAAGNVDKALHHVITSAAMLANWHSAITGADTRMRPGIAPPPGEGP